MFSLRGSGDLQTWDGHRWESHFMQSDPAGSFTSRWLSIPANVWHKPVMSHEDWIVVSFHTASATDLIEERPADDERPKDTDTRREVYAGRRFR
jgi:hypothetical protein